MEIENLRKSIDQLDSEIADRLRARKFIVDKIQSIKKERDINRVDKNREEEILSRLKLENPEIPNMIDKVWSVIFNQVYEFEE